MVVADSPHSLGDVLIRDGHLNQSQLRKALDQQKATSESLGRVLVRMGFISEVKRMEVLQQDFGFDLIQLKGQQIAKSVLALIPPVFAQRHRILPIRVENDETLIVAMEDPLDIMIVEMVKNQTNYELKPYIATSLDLEKTLRDQYDLLRETGEAGEDTGKAKEHGRLYHFFRTVGIPLLYFLPLPMFFGALVVIEPFYKWVARLPADGKHDIGIYTALSWALWAILIFEIRGIFFSDDDESSEKSDN